MVEIPFYSPHPRPLPKGARELLFPSRCLEAALGKTVVEADSATADFELGKVVDPRFSGGLRLLLINEIITSKLRA